MRIKRFHVNTSFRRFWSDAAYSERNLIPNKRDGLCRSLFHVHNCSDHVSLVGVKLPLVHVCPPFPRRGGSWRFPVCSPVNCIACHDGLDICIITVSNAGQWKFLLLAAKEETPVITNYFWVSENGEIMYRNACNSLMGKEILFIQVLTDCGKVATTLLSVTTLRTAHAGVWASSLGGKKRLMLLTVIMLISKPW